jgi:hypothetical protein
METKTTVLIVLTMVLTMVLIVHGCTILRETVSICLTLHSYGCDRL